MAPSGEDSEHLKLKKETNKIMTTFEEAYKFAMNQPDKWLNECQTLHNAHKDTPMYMENIQQQAMELLVKDIMTNSDHTQALPGICARLEMMFLFGLQIGLTMNRSDWEPSAQ